MYVEDVYEHVSPGLIYVDTTFPGSGVDEELFSSRPEGCSCYPVCEKYTCACLSRSGATEVQDSSAGVANHHPIFQCNSDCKCEARCENRITQMGPRKKLKVVPFQGKGFGVMTEDDIPEGSFVCEYAGEAIGEQEARRRFASMSSSDANYILVLREHIAYGTSSAHTQTTIIDPTVTGNIGRYLNHSCSPNLNIVPIRSESFVPIAAMISARDIKAGEELCYHYDSTIMAERDSQNNSGTVGSSYKPCLCGSANCKRFLPSNSIIF